MLSATATAPAGMAPAPRTFSLEELARRSDALALTVGTRATASALLLACVVVILVGAQSLLGTMEGMDRDIKEMNRQMAMANEGLVVLNTTMDSVEPTSGSLGAIVKNVEDTSANVKVSKASIGRMAAATGKLNTKLGSIATSTTAMRGSLESAAGGTNTLATTIDDLNGKITPLVATQHDMLLGTRRMRSALDGMNASLAYTIRIMNWIAAPPHGGGMTINAEMNKATLPPLPGIRAEVKPVKVFERNIWPIYSGR